MVWPEGKIFEIYNSRLLQNALKINIHVFKVIFFLHKTQEISCKLIVNQKCKKEKYEYNVTLFEY